GRLRRAPAGAFAGEVHAHVHAAKQGRSRSQHRGARERCADRDAREGARGAAAEDRRSCPVLRRQRLEEETMTTDTLNIEKRRDSSFEPARGAQRAFVPAVDIYENKDEVLIVADLPGVEQDKLAVRLDRNHLSIEAKRSLPGAGERTLEYRRTFVVP